MKMENLYVLLGLAMISSCAPSSKNTRVVKPDAPEKAPEIPTKAYPERAKFEVECKYGEQSFSIDFESKSGDLKNKDMSVIAKFKSDDADTEVPLKLAPATYRAVDTSGLKSICDGVPAFQIENTPQFLFVFNVDQRPQFPETSLVLLDVAKKRVVNKLEHIGQLKTTDVPKYQIIPAQNGFQMRLIRNLDKKTEDWKWIIVKKGMLTAKWMSGGGRKSKAY
ncbi:MAG: hypothetical protein JST80_10505 [Bdellovibrionales bacterium]|nr:hypothetical protein [Bdellovibrionales bacterium]